MENKLGSSCKLSLLLANLNSRLCAKLKHSTHTTIETDTKKNNTKQYKTMKKTLKKSPNKKNNKSVGKI
jgi:hypothetical protein